MIKAIGKTLLVVILFLCSFNIIYADQYHYIDVLVGERASGLGGAFVALSDDPSGTYYNPAGMAFTTKGYITTSTNTYKTSKSIFSDVLVSSKSGSADWERKSTSFIPNFFGVLQKVGPVNFAFSVIMPESDLVNQDSVMDMEFDVTANNMQYLNNNNQKTTKYLIGPSLAYLVRDDFSIGGSIFIAQTTNEIINTQWIKWVNQKKRFTIQTFYDEQKIFGLDGIFGFQYMPSEKYSLGATVKYGHDFTASADQQQIVALQDQTNLSEGTHDLLKMGYKSTPLKLTIGGAYFYSPKLIFVGDLKYHLAHDPGIAEFMKKSVMNLSLGTEFYPTMYTPIRLGFYTNNSTLGEGYAGSYDINLYGFTTSVGYETEFSSLSLGVNYSIGTGSLNMPNNQGVLKQFDAKMTNLHIFFSGSYMM